MAEQWALKRAASLAADRFRLTSFWCIDYFRQQVSEERKTRYTTAPRPIRELRNCLRSHFRARRQTTTLSIGEDSREILKDRRLRNDIDRTALIDLVMGQVSPAAGQQVVLDQTLRDKYARRSRLFADEADSYTAAEGYRVRSREINLAFLSVGATAGAIGALVSCGFAVAATDMDPDVVGQNLGGVTVCDERENGKTYRNS